MSPIQTKTQMISRGFQGHFRGFQHCSDPFCGHYSGHDPGPHLCAEITLATPRLDAHRLLTWRSLPDRIYYTPVSHAINRRILSWRSGAAGILRGESARPLRERPMTALLTALLVALSVPAA